MKFITLPFALALLALPLSSGAFASPAQQADDLLMDIDRIVAQLPRHQYGLRELIHQVVASEPFHTK